VNTLASILGGGVSVLLLRVFLVGLRARLSVTEEALMSSSAFAIGTFAMWMLVTKFIPPAPKLRDLMPIALFVGLVWGAVTGASAVLIDMAFPPSEALRFGPWAAVWGAFVGGPLGLFTGFAAAPIASLARAEGRLDAFDRALFVCSVVGVVLALPVAVVCGGVEPSVLCLLAAGGLAGAIAIERRRGAWLKQWSAVPARPEDRALPFYVRPGDHVLARRQGSEGGPFRGVDRVERLARIDPAAVARVRSQRVMLAFLLLMVVIVTLPLRWMQSR
jgi:hypothetical protein